MECQKRFTACASLPSDFFHQALIVNQIALFHEATFYYYLRTRTKLKYKLSDSFGLITISDRMYLCDFQLYNILFSN